MAAMATLTQAPGPVAAPPPAAAAQPATPAFRFSVAFAVRRTPVRYESARELMLIRATVAGRSTWVLLDTGARHSIVDASLARAAGLRTGPAPISIATPSGSLAGNLVEGLRITVPGQMDVNMSLAPSVDLRPASTLLGRPVEAVIGWDILSRLAFLVDPRRQTIDFAPSGQLPPPVGAAALPLSGVGRIPVGVVGTQLSLFIDLGSNHAVGLGADRWERLAPKGAETRPYEVSHAQGGGEHDRLGLLPEIRLGEARIPNIPTVIETRSPLQDDGHIGMGLLSRFIFMLDATQGRFYYVPAQPAGPRPVTRLPLPPPGAGR